MTHGPTRLFNPASIAVIGGGAWSEAVLQQAQKFGYAGKLYAVHPSKADVDKDPIARKPHAKYPFVERHEEGKEGPAKKKQKT